MADQVEIQAPKTRWYEGSAFAAAAYFRDRATAAADTPTNVYYRIDCLKTGTELQDWTSVSAASSVNIAVTPTHNAIQNQGNRRERKQLTVVADYGLSTEHKGIFVWQVENLRGSP